MKVVTSLVRLLQLAIFLNMMMLGGGDYWRFTKKGMERILLEGKFDIIDLRGFGNVLAAKAMFDGLVVEDFSKSELLEVHDSGYPVIISFMPEAHAR